MPVNIRIDFSEVNYVDAACVGLLTLLYGHQTQTGRGLSIVFVSNKVRRLFKLYGAGYILERLPNA
jgi:N-acetylglucosaminyldiphosphoundecaprenol N-acetyl-beta-D-mannosaminyltransferase